MGKFDKMPTLEKGVDLEDLKARFKELADKLAEQHGPDKEVQDTYREREAIILQMMELVYEDWSNASESEQQEIEAEIERIMKEVWAENDLDDGHAENLAGTVVENAKMRVFQDNK